MSARFFAPGAEAPGDRITLSEDESAHLTRVLRLRPGDTLRVFNGRGGEFEARVEAAGRDGVTVSLSHPVTPALEPRIPITIAQSVLKGDKMDDVVRDTVMLGAAAILPFVSARSETSLGALERSRRRARWQRIAVAACKQCGRATLPVIHAPRTFDALLADPPPGLTLMFVEPHASPGAPPLSALDAGPPPSATIVVGPEGGWSAEEIEAAARIWRLATLRLPTIRADAMAAVAMSALLATWREI